MFQLSAFQRNAFQIGYITVSPPAGGGVTRPENGNWRRTYNEAMAKLRDQPYRDYLEAQEREKQAEIIKIEARLAQIEKRRLAALADEKLQLLLLAELAALDALLKERAELQRQAAFMRDEEEAMLVLLLSNPFYA